MLTISVAVVVGLFASLFQAPPASSPARRFQVTLEYRGVWGLATQPDGTCPGVPPGTDRLTGIVERTRVSDEGVEYTGRLTRTTTVGLCEARETGDGARWCAGEIAGGGVFLVIITIPARGNDNEDASVEMKPELNVSAKVGGNCDSLDNAAVADDYEDGDTQHFETANHAAGRVLPTGGLVPGTWWQTSRTGPDAGYKIVVAAVP